MKTNRQIAIAAGEKRYHGRPCKNCQERLKYTNDGKCVICAATSKKKWHQENPEKVSAYDKNWQQNNKDKKYAFNAKYRAIKNSARNKMLSELFAPEINALYAKAEQLARDTGIPHHVHHYIPLALGGTNSISNLYVIPDTWNLQIGSKDPNNLTNPEDKKLREQILKYKCN